MRSAHKNNLKLFIFAAMLSALSIVLGKVLAFNLGEVIRFSFENLPILFAAYAFSPIAAMLVALIADLVGCFMVGYAINPIVTLGAVVIGGVGGVVFHILKKLKLPLLATISLGVLSAHLIGSVIVKTIGLSAFYSMPLITLMLWRLLNYTIIGTLEGMILYLLFKNKYLISSLTSFKQGRAGDEEKSKSSEVDEDDLR